MNMNMVKEVDRDNGRKVPIVIRWVIFGCKYVNLT